MPDWVQVAVSAAGGVLSAAVVLGVYKQRLHSLEALVSAHTERMHDRGDQLQAVAMAQEVSKRELEAAIIRQRQEIHETFVTWKHFESSLTQIRAEQHEIKSDVKALLEMVTEIRAHAKRN